ncbi:MAG: TonB-dependent receptor domain-containing protein [Bacteroidales bacterium]
MFSLLNVSAQKNDTILSISGVEIKADKISIFAAGLKIEKIDSTTLSVRKGISIASFLAEQSPVFIRSYGPGGVSSLSMRGTNASQSGVFWNGINLSQPNMGMADLSRISTFEFSDISLQAGGASALLGSGVMGGSLHLSNTLRFSTPVQSSVFISASTAGKCGTGIKLSAGSHRLAYNGTLSGDWNKNNFKYTDYNGQPTYLDHALSKSVSSIHQAEYKLNKKQKLTAGFWYQLTDREIPPTMTMASSDQQQRDQAIRSSLQWLYLDNIQSYIIRTAFIDEKEDYKSETALIDAYYHLNTLQTDFEYKRTLTQQITVGSGATAHIIRANVPYYDGVELQPEGSVWMAFVYHASKTGVKSVLNFRQDFSKGYKVPFCPSLSVELPVSKIISTSFGLSRNFRVPTMNDRFWLQGGNPDLNPENSWNLETGAAFQFKQTKYYQSKIVLSFYSLLIDNMIQWVPGDAGIWTPQNVLKVWSRGIEVSSKTDFKIVGLNGYFRLGYNYTPSTYRETSEDEQDMLSKQLIYIPLHKVNETFYFSKGNYYTMFSYSITGKRYVQSDNSKSLKAYSLLDFYTGVTFNAAKSKFRLQAEVRNLMNKTYQSVQYYPEPGISFSINLLITI